LRRTCCLRFQSVSFSVPFVVLFFSRSLPRHLSSRWAFAFSLAFARLSLAARRNRRRARGRRRRQPRGAPTGLVVVSRGASSSSFFTSLRSIVCLSSFFASIVPLSFSSSTPSFLVCGGISQSSTPLDFSASIGDFKVSRALTSSLPV